MEEQEVVTPEGAEEVVVQEIPAETPVVTEPETPEPAAVEPVVEEAEEVVIPHPVKKTAQERINELTRKRHEAEREAERLRQELANKTKAPEPLAGRPKIENYETQEAYENDLLKWGLSELKREEEQTKRQREQAELEAQFQEDVAKLQDTYGDINEVIYQFPSTPTIVDTIYRAKNKALLAYYLGKNPNVAETICKLPSQSQIYELAQLEVKLVNAQRTKKPTGAPKPISPVGATGGNTIDESKLSDEEWFKLEKQREYEKIKKKYGG